MAEFRQKVRRSAVRKLTRPIRDIAAFDAVISDILMNNPLGCASYRSAGATHPPVEKVREMYTAKFVYRDRAGKQVGAGSEYYNSRAGFEAGIAAVMANLPNIAAHGGSVARDPDSDSYAVTLKCYDAGGEIYALHFARDRITLSSYRNDAIRTRIEAWMRGVPALA